MAESEIGKVPISKKLADNIKWLKEEMGVAESFDVICREIRFAGRDAAVFFVNGFTRDEIMVFILQSLAKVRKEQLAVRPFDKIMQEHIPYTQVEVTDDLHQVVDNVLSGPMALFIDGEDRAIIIDARKYPSRNPGEPDLERVVRGSRDGFVETLVANTVLIRRRVRDPRLCTEILQAGQRSKTDICVCYLKDVANPKLVQMVKDKIEAIKIDGLPMAEKSVEELITPGNTWNPFPKVRYTERPDVAAVQLLEGRILVLVDTSPSVMILPATIFDHLQHAEEFRQTPAVGLLVRLVRYLGVLASVFLLPFWLLLALEPSLRPSWLSFIGPEKAGVIPLVVQFLLAELGINLMRLAAIHTPESLTTALGLIAAVLIGQVAVSVGLFSPETILYTAIGAVGTFATPSYELSMANTYVRIFLLVAVSTFRLTGLVIGMLILLAFLLFTKSFGVPYLWPLIPLDWGALKTALIRSPIKLQHTRPSVLNTLDRDRQPSPAYKRRD